MLAVGRGGRLSPVGGHRRCRIGSGRHCLEIAGGRRRRYRPAGPVVGLMGMPSLPDLLEASHT